MTSPRSGATIPTGAHAKNTGGKKGRSGRKPLDFVLRCQAIATDPVFLDKLETDAKAGDRSARETVIHYAVGKPKETVQHVGALGGAIAHEMRVLFVNPPPVDAGG